MSVSGRQPAQAGWSREWSERIAPPPGDPGWRSCLCPQSNLWVGIRKLSVRCWEHGYRVEVYVPAWDRKAASGRASGLPVQAGSRCGSARTKAVESRGRESVLSGCQSPVLPRRGPDHAVHPEGQRIHIPLGMRILPNGSAYGGMGLPMPEREFRGWCYRPHSAEMLLWFLSTGEVSKPRVQPPDHCVQYAAYRKTKPAIEREPSRLMCRAANR